MKAIEVARFGGPEVLEPVSTAEPEPDAGELVVDVGVAGVLMLDVVIRRGDGGTFFPVEPPYVPGRGAAGTVSAVGAGVDRAWIGRRVVADVTGGGYAERLAAPVENIVPVPGALTDQDAMALLHDGRTALGLLENTPVRAGETALVMPAAGGLGNLLVQLLVARGVTVIGVSRKPEVVRALGARPVAHPAELGASPDVVFDGVGGEAGASALALLERGGRFSAYGSASGVPTDTASTPVGVSTIGGEQLGTLLPGAMARAARMLDEAAAGRLRPVIGRVDTLDRAADAHRALESRAVAGKAVLAVG